MPKYQIMTPDGFEVEVSASSQAEAIEKAKKGYKQMPRIIAKDAGDVRVFERANGQRYLVAPSYSTTDPEKINEVLQKGASAGDVSKSSMYEDIIQQYPVASRVSQFIKGAPFVGSYSDEMVGALAGEDAAVATRAAQAAMESERPTETLALNLAGGITGSAGLGAAAPKVLREGATRLLTSPTTMRNLPAMAKTAATGAAVGALEGGVYGAGEGTSAEERAQSAQEGAAFGAGAGLLFGGLTPVATKAAKNLANVIKRSDLALISSALNISQSAAKVIKNAFEMGGTTDDAMAAVQRAGEQGMLADAGPAAQALLDAANASGGGASQRVKGSLDERMAQTNTALRSSLDQSLGEAPVGPRSAVEQIAQRTAPERDRLYSEAFSTPINYAAPEGAAVEAVLAKTPSGLLKGAIDDANEVISMQGMPRDRQIKASIADDGSVTFIEMPNVMQLDQLKRSLQEIANQNVDTFGRLNAKGSRYNNLASELRDAVSEAVPVYRDAVSLGGDKIAEESAFKLGADLLSKGTELEDVMRTLGPDASVAQVDAAKQGLRRYIEKTLGDVQAIASDPTAEAIDAREVVKAVTAMSSKNARAKIRALLGAEADALIAKIDEAGQSSAVRAAVAVNSKTAQRRAVDENIEELTRRGVIGTAMAGDPINTSKLLIQNITGQTDEFSVQQRQKIYDDIARALTERRGKSAQEALKLIDKAIKGQELSEAQNEFVARQVAAVLYGGAATTTGRAVQPSVE